MSDHDLIARAEKYRHASVAMKHPVNAAQMVSELTTALRECRERRDEAAELVQIARAQHKRQDEQTTALLLEAAEALEQCSTHIERDEAAHGRTYAAGRVSRSVAARLRERLT